MCWSTVWQSPNPVKSVRINEKWWRNYLSSHHFPLTFTSWNTIEETGTNRCPVTTDYCQRGNFLPIHNYVDVISNIFFVVNNDGSNFKIPSLLQQQTSHRIFLRVQETIKVILHGTDNIHQGDDTCFPSRTDQIETFCELSDETTSVIVPKVVLFHALPNLFCSVVIDICRPE